MEGQHHQMLRIEDEEEEKKKNIQAKKDVQHPKQQVQPNSSPPSASSSPSHEFSFTISLHPSAAKISSPAPPLAAAIDLSPADEIFFHGHLLPLHLLSHLPVSPRSSTNSLDSFTLPIKELLREDHGNNTNNKTSSTSSSEEYSTINDHHRSRHVLEGKGRGKSKSFSLFGIPKWRSKLGFHDDEEKDDDDHQTHEKRSKSSKFDLFKRYMRFVKPFLSLRNKRGSSGEFLRQPPYSYSGNLRLRSKKKELRGRRGEFSAPVSMRTSPTNSGLLIASGTATPTSASDSTMEELQAAIQAAIAHCKKSIGTEDTIKVP